MFLWFVMLLSALLVPGLMVAFGGWIWKHPPEKINDLWGYRTKRSMQNADTWRFAQEYSGRLMWKLGWVLLVLSAVVMVALIGSDAVFYAVLLLWAAQLAGLLYVFPSTERAMKAAFTDGGTRR